MISKRIVLILFLVLLPFIFARAQTQLEMNAEAHHELKLSEQTMDSVFRAVVEKYDDSPEFISRLKKAQEAWTRYRDAHLESMYPGKNKRVTYGSVYPLCASNLLVQLNNQRTEQLKKWLDGIEEGDVCAGSVRFTSLFEL